MKDKSILFLLVLTLCVFSLILGCITPIKNTITKINTEDKKSNQNINNIINSGFNKIAVIELNGVINSTPERNLFVEENSSLAALSALNSAESDKNVKGIILRINSPGGTVGMSQRLYSAVYNARKVKPVISVIDDVAASGGYYVASASDRIVSLPGSMTGSIGVIMSTMDAHELLSNKLGIKENVIKSGKYKDIGSYTRAMTGEERELLQEMVDDSFLQFKDAIIEGRVKRNDTSKAAMVKLSIENLNKYADGRVFTGRQALKYGFVDSNGGMREAQRMMKIMLQEKQIPTEGLNYEKYGKTNSFLNALGLNQTSSSFDSFIPQSVKFARTPLYLWE
ncbi:MAG: signal peptide peptidase SppA [Candidatus Gastranaerophilaceae bacterium]